MSDVECPYCGAEQKINYDDGCGIAEGEIHEQQCGDCEKYFAFTTSISFYHSASKADCLNDSEHKYEATHTYPVEATQMECPDCGARRDPTKEEMDEILRERIE